MRHDSHYVEELAQHRPTPIGRMIAVERLDPNPEQPRVEIGDLEEPTSSIKEKGVLEPLLVKPSKASGRWMIIAGERRWSAAREAGLREVPCIEMDVDDRAVAEIARLKICSARTSLRGKKPMDCSLSAKSLAIPTMKLRARLVRS